MISSVTLKCIEPKQMFNLSTKFLECSLPRSQERHAFGSARIRVKGIVGLHQDGAAIRSLLVLRKAAVQEASVTGSS